MDHKQRIKRALGQIAEIPAGYAYLGRGDGARVIVSSFPNRTVYISGTNVGAEAKLSQEMSITRLNNPNYEGLRVKLGYPNYDPTVLYVTSVDTVEGMAALNNLSLNEAEVAEAQFPDVGRIINLRLSPNDPNDLNIYVSPSPYYDVDGAWHWFGGDGLDDDFTATIAALSGQHQIAVVYLDTATGELNTVLNTAETGGVADKDSFNASTIESLTFGDGYILCGALHLYAGQTAITESDIYRTFDPRVIFPTPNATGGVIGTFSDDELREMIWIGLV